MTTKHEKSQKPLPLTPYVGNFTGGVRNVDNT